VRVYGAKATLVELRSLEPCWDGPSWTRALPAKRVLVISPFAASMEKQYLKHRLLRSDPEMLPDFGLSTIRAPLSAGLVPLEDCDWFEALAGMKRKMDSIDYDVSLVGAGAFLVAIGCPCEDARQDRCAPRRRTADSIRGAWAAMAEECARQWELVSAES
jgi:hypothetical protein